MVKLWVLSIYDKTVYTIFDKTINTILGRIPFVFGVCVNLAETAKDKLVDIFCFQVW